MNSLQDSPFLVGNASAYAAWRERKLANYPVSAADLLVDINDPRQLSGAEKNLISNLLIRCNMLIYNSNMGDSEDKEIPRRLGQQL